MVDTRPKIASEQRLFSDHSQAGRDLQAAESLTEDVQMTDSPPPTSCQRKAYIFAGCGDAYIAPPCSCCTTPQPTTSQPIIPFTALTRARTPISALASFKQTKFKAQCPACQILTLDISLEIAKQNYEGNRELWGDEHLDEDTLRDYLVLDKMGGTYQRLSMAIARDSPNVEGWEQVYVGDVSLVSR